MKHALSWFLIALVTVGLAATIDARPRQRPFRGRPRQPPPPPPVVRWHGGPAWPRPMPWVGMPPPPPREHISHTWSDASRVVVPSPAFYYTVWPDTVTPAKDNKPKSLRASKKTIALPAAIRPVAPPAVRQPVAPSPAPRRVWVEGRWRYTRDANGTITGRTWETGHWETQNASDD